MQTQRLGQRQLLNMMKGNLEKRILHLMTRRLTEARNYNQATLSKYFFLMKHLISSVKAKAAYLMLAADRPII